jgi:hypothetical protein
MADDVDEPPPMRMQRIRLYLVTPDRPTLVMTTIRKQANMSRTVWLIMNRFTVSPRVFFELRRTDNTVKLARHPMTPIHRSEARRMVPVDAVLRAREEFVEAIDVAFV